MIKPVADDHLAPVQRRFDLFEDVLAARCIEKQKLCGGGQMNRFRVKQDFPDTLAYSGSAGLAGYRMRDISPREYVGKKGDLCRFSTTFDPLKTNKPSVFHGRARRGIVAEPPRTSGLASGGLRHEASTRSLPPD